MIKTYISSNRTWLDSQYYLEEKHGHNKEDR